MKKILLFASILAISLFLTACTSMNSGQKIAPSETTNGHSSNTYDETQLSSANDCTFTKDSFKERRKSDLFEFELFRNNSNHKINKTSNISSDQFIIQSKEISHALDLCGYAQKAWEKGDNSKAIEYLDAAYASILKMETDDARVNKQKEDLRFMISKRVMEIYTSKQKAVKGEHNEIPITINKYVQNEIDRFIGNEKEFFVRAMARAAEYRPFIIKELKEAGLPEELSWLPLIESGFRVQALSPARALGLWQFIPSTGYKFGLKRDYYVDERMDPFKSTKAAIEYLSELHKMFGDWSTVLAAYNCGEGRVLRTIRSQNVNYLDDFWDLYEKLPRETACYVPRFLATLHIVNNLDKYGMPPQRNIPPLEFQTVTVNKQLRLTDIARKMSVSRTLLETLNPELKYGVLPPEEYKLRIPANTTDIFLASLDDIAPSEPVPPKSYSFHKVKSGETLFSIAKHYGVTMSDLAAANNISTKSNLSASKTIKIPTDSYFSNQQQYSTASVRNSSTNREIEESSESDKKNNGYSQNKKSKDENNRIIAKSKLTKTIKYTVKQGDTMWSIARKYNTTPDSIKDANKLSGYKVIPNKELIIPHSVVEIAANSKNSQESNSINSKNINSKKRDGVTPKKSTHWVKSGDTPFTIAQKYNMSVQRLFDLNRLTKESKIFPGQQLIIK